MGAALRVDPKFPANFRAKCYSKVIEINADAVIDRGLVRAWGIGYNRGIHDHHYEVEVFSGPEWIAWLRGWREGQNDMKASRESEDKAGVEAEKRGMVRLKRLYARKRVAGGR